MAVLRAYAEPIGTQVCLEFYGSLPQTESEEFASLVDQLTGQCDVLALQFFNVSSGRLEDALVIRDLVSIKTWMGQQTIQLLYGENNELAYCVQDAQSKLFMSSNASLSIQDPAILRITRRGARVSVPCKLDQYQAYNSQLVDVVPDPNLEFDPETLKKLLSVLNANANGCEDEEEEERNGN